MLNVKLLNIKLNLHDDANMNVTGDSGMTVEMKTYYDMTLLKNAFPKLVHNQFGQKRPIPKGKGKTIEFRKFTPLGKALTPLSEGVTPTGQKLSATNLEATISQYGAYVTTTDMLEMTTIDPVLQEGAQLLGEQAGETIDTITREIINGGTNAQYFDGTKSSRAALVGKNATWGSNSYFNCEVIRRAMLTLSVNKARSIEGTDGEMVCIIHPDAEYCLKKDTEWVSYQVNQHAQKIFKGEIGIFDNCRFVKSTEAKVFSAKWLSTAAKNLTVASLATKTFTIDEALSAAEVTAMVGRKIWVKNVLYTVASGAAGAAGAATITVSETVTGTPGDGEVIYPGDMDKDGVLMPDLGVDVISCLFIGADAYGIVEIEGKALETITKQLGSAGSADPLNQRATQGWKAIHTAKILTNEWMVRAEVATPFDRGAN